MRSNVIKTTEYNEIAHANDVCRILPEASELAVPEIKAEAAVNIAFSKAKQIVDAANEYGARHIKETMDRLNAEGVKIRKQSFEEGFAIGMTEGKKAGEERGYSDGYEDGLKAAEKENQKYINELLQMIEAVETSKTQLLQKFEGDLLGLSLTIAEKIVRKEIAMDAGILTEMVKNAMDSHRNQAWIRIIVSQGTAGAFAAADNRIIEALSGISDNIKIIGNPNLSDTDCLIEMPDQIIDIGAETQLNNIRMSIDAASQK